MEDIKQASNFELNVLNLGNKRFQLVKGDRFTSNGNTFDYNPSTEENKAQMRFSNYHRETSISAKKYQKDVLRADNIKLVVDRPLSTDEPADSEYNVLNRWRVWEVQYSYVQPIPEFESLIVLVIDQSIYNDKGWDFEAHELEVERETKLQYYLKKSHPVNHGSQINKTELNVPSIKYDTYHVICKIEDYNEMELKLFAFANENLQERIKTAEELVIKRIKSLEKFNELKEKQGF